MSRTPAAPDRTKLSPPEVARRWGVSAEKVIAWIRSGELRAIDAATHRGGRPRYLVDLVDLAEFEAKRAVVATPATHRRRRRKDPAVIQYF